MKKTKLPLRFHRNGTFCGDGTFRILLLSDLHGGTYCSPKLFRAIDALLTETSPDLVLLGGDLLDPGCFDDGVCTADTLRAYLSCILEPLSRRGIPFAVTIGDSDRACGMTAEELFAVYGESPLCISAPGSDVVPVYSSKIDCDARTAYNMFLLDSTASPDGITFGEAAWYYDTSRAMEEENRHKIPAILFAHHPIPEYILCGENPEETDLTGIRRGTFSYPAHNSGLFMACLERGDIKGIFSGHEHTSNAAAVYCGITLASGGAVGYDMPLSCPTHDDIRGGRVIDLYENGAMETRYVRLLDVMGLDALRDPGRFAGGGTDFIRKR
ncbi:MAG: metallophosphoesterase [Clostridia bacterium]|nr:metallophosphoesterase [Clostridia bacterium]